MKNLISMRELTHDNNVSVSFDPFGLFVTNFKTGIPLMRCDSFGDFYPVTTLTSFGGLASDV